MREAWTPERANARSASVGYDALTALADPASWPLVAGRDDADELTAVPRKMGNRLERGLGPAAAEKGSRC